MTYILYADVMLIWNTAINMAVICICLSLQKKKIKLFSTFLWSFTTATITGIEYILTINENKMFHTLLYAFIYIFMLELYLGHTTLFGLGKSLFCIVSVMAILYGLLAFGNLPHRKILITLILLAVITLIILFVVRKYLFQRDNVCEKQYNIRLIYKDKSIETIGYVDTGNMLRDPYTKCPVMVIDYRLLKHLFKENIYKYIVDYHKTGNFSYLKIKEKSNICFYPIPYTTISTNFALMPAFRIDYLEYNDLYTKIPNVVCGISRYKLKNTKEYQVLLTESLKPIREENSND